jgi:hypothetical protein
MSELESRTVIVSVGQLRMWAHNLRYAAQKLVPPGQLADIDQRLADRGSALTDDELIEVGRDLGLSGPGLEAYRTIRLIAEDLDAAGERGA